MQRSTQLTQRSNWERTSLYCPSFSNALANVLHFGLSLVLRRRHKNIRKPLDISLFQEGVSKFSLNLTEHYKHKRHCQILRKHPLAVLTYVRLLLHLVTLQLHSQRTCRCCCGVGLKSKKGNLETKIGERSERSEPSGGLPPSPLCFHSPLG